MSLILHITSRERWQAAQAAGEYRDPSLEKEGFIHASTPQQVVRTGNRFYQGQSDLVLLCIDTDQLTARWVFEDASHPEPVVDETIPNRPEQFPHIYGPLNVDAVVGVVDFVAEPDGLFVLPSEVQQYMK
ncbi:MAG: DUF952 domain-containing protein [Anaerolineae bacterium]|nr:DUF952 domain-containing protein [Anaerolineae bacterium]